MTKKPIKYYPLQIDKLLHDEIKQYSAISGMKIYRLAEIAWREFKTKHKIVMPTLDDYHE